MKTLDDQQLFSREDMVLFPGTDQVLLSFKLGTRRQGDSDGRLLLHVTDKLGVVQQTVDLAASDRLICDYTATIHNFLNFDILTGKRVEFNVASLLSMLSDVQQTDRERDFQPDRVRNIH